MLGHDAAGLRRQPGLAVSGAGAAALSAYALVALNRDSRLSSEAAIKYFVLGALASGMLLYGMSMVYGATGTLGLDAIHLRRDDDHACPACCCFGLVFMVVGIGFKFGAAPFHMWIPDVYEGAPTPVTTFIAPRRSWPRSAWRADCWNPAWEAGWPTGS